MTTQWVDTFDPHALIELMEVEPLEWREIIAEVIEIAGNDEGSEDEAAQS